jgi:hypothetical protein
MLCHNLMIVRGCGSLNSGIDVKGERRRAQRGEQAEQRYISDDFAGFHDHTSLTLVSLTKFAACLFFLSFRATIV